jgi:AsmA protein
MSTKRSLTRRLMRFIGFGILNLLVLVIVIALVAPMVFDPNDYKDTIAEQFKTRTGRDLTIVGDMSFSVLPWLGVSTGEVRVGHAADSVQTDNAAGNQSFARVSSADVRVKLVPLLSREVQMDTINVRGLEVHLARDVDGRGNWEDLLAHGQSGGDSRGAETPATQEQGHGQDKTGGGLALAAFALGGVHIENAAVTFVDARNKQPISLSAIDLRTGEVSIGEPIDVQVSLRFAHPEGVGKAAGKARLNYDLSAARVSAENLELSTEVEAQALGAGVTSAKINGAVSWDNAAQHVVAKALNFAMSGPIELNGAGDIDLRLREQTVSSPDLQLAVQNLRHGTTTVTVKMNSNVAVNLVSRQLALTGLRGNAQLSGDSIKGEALPVSFGADVTADLPAQWVQVANLKLSAEGLNLAGDVRAESIIDSPVVTGTLAAPQFALDKLLARAGVQLPATRDPKVLKSAAFSGKFKFDGKRLSVAPANLELDDNTLKGTFAATTDGALAFDLSASRLNVDRYLPASAPGAPPPAALGALPVTALRGLDIDGALKVGSLRYSGLDLANVRIGIKAKDSQLHLSPLEAKLYSGNYKGNIRIDARKDQPVMHLNEQIDKVDASALFKALKISTGALDLSGGRTSLVLKTTVTTDTAGKTIRANNIALDGKVSGRAFRRGAVPIKMRGDVSVDLVAKRASMKKASIRFAELNVAGHLDTRFAPGQLQYDGTLDVTPFNARTLASRLGIPLPKTGNRKSLTAIGGKANISGNGRSIKATKMAMKLDSSTIKGDFTVLDFASLALAFNVDVDAINLDHYLPPSAKGKAATPGAAATALPVDLVRSLNLDGQVRIGKLTVSGIKMSKVVVTANAKNGILKLSPLGAALYQGRYDGNVVMDASASAPRISLDETIKGVQIGALLQDVRGNAPLTGATDLRATLTAIGGNTESLKRTVDGNISFAIHDGTIEKVDMVNSMCTTLAALDFDNLNKQTIAAGLIGLLLDSSKSRAPTNSSGSGGTRTEFSEMTGTAILNKGIARNDDLAMSSPIVRVRGAGTIDLPRDRLNYRAEAELVQSCAGIGKRDLAGQIIPVTITGAITNPKVQPQIPTGLINALRKRRPAQQAAPQPTAKTAPAAQAPLTIEQLLNPSTAPAQAPAPVEQAQPQAPAPPPSAKEQRKELLKGLLKGLLK